MRAAKNWFMGEPSSPDELRAMLTTSAGDWGKSEE
jgi:hypothetical protein